VRSAAAPLVTTLSSQGQAAVQAQVHAAEQLVHPVQCAPQVRATPAVGAEATQVTVAVRVTCQAEVYNADEMQARVGALLGQEATTNLAPGYTRQSEVTATLSSMTTVVARSGIVAFHVQAEGVWAYHLSAAQLHALTTLVAGQPFQEARAILLHAQGIHQVTITSTAWWDDAGQQTLPADPNRIQVVDFSWVGMESRKEEVSHEAAASIRLQALWSCTEHATSEYDLSRGKVLVQVRDMPCMQM
jgi:hypothetical protein